MAMDPMCSDAFPLLEEARQLDPTLGRAWFGIGLCQGLRAWLPELPRDNPLWESAIHNLSRAAEMDSSIAPRAWEMAANLEAARNQWEAARLAQDSAQSLNPGAFAFVLANSVGDCASVPAWAEAQFALDPLMPVYINQLSMAFATCPGIIDGERAVYFRELATGMMGDAGETASVARSTNRWLMSTPCTSIPCLAKACA